MLKAAFRFLATFGFAAAFFLTPAGASATTPLPDPHGSGVLTYRFGSEAEASLACRLAAAQAGGMVVRTSGTPSMEPLIHGQAYVVVRKQAYDGIRKSDLLVYMGKLSPRASQRTCTLHRAVDHDRFGWIMSGDNNRWTESWDRVTPENYVGTVVAIFEAAADARS